MKVRHNQGNLFEQIRVARKNMSAAQRALSAVASTLTIDMVESEDEREEADPGRLVKVRNQKPVEIWYATGSDARECRKRACEEYGYSDPCFVTSSLGADGFIWDTCDEVDEAIEELSSSIAGYVVTSEAVRNS